MLEFLAQRIAAEGVPPSQTEIQQAFGFKSVRAAQYHLDALEAAGAIKRAPGRARGIRILRAPPSPQSELRLTVANDDALRLPILGQVAAGAPIDPDVGEHGYLALDRALFRPAPDYLLKVKGNSMIDEGILDGDLLGVHRTRDARSGQIVVARVDGEITVKRLEIDKNHIRLLPRNPQYAPIAIEPTRDFAVEGLYCGLVRPHR